MMASPTIRLTLSGASALLVLAGGHAHGAWVIEPSAQLQTSYEDNVRLEQDEDDAIVTSATAQARVRNVTETSQVSGVAGLTYLNYSGADELDDEEAGFLEFDAGRNTERVGYGVRASLRSDVILRRVDRIPEGFDLSDRDMGDGAGAIEEELPELGLDVDEGVVREQIERRSMLVSPYLAYSLTERSQTRVGYTFYGLRYDDDARDAGLQESDSHSVFAQLSREVTPLDTMDVRIRASHFEPEASLESDNYELTVGWQRQISPRLTLGGEIGGRRVESDISNDEGLVFSLRGSYDTERGRFSGSLQRSVLPSAFGDVVEADRLELSYRRSLSQRATFSFSLRGYETRRDSGNSDRDRSFLTAAPNLSYALSPTWNVGVGYTYRWTDREDELGSASGNAVSLSLVYRPPSRL